MTTNLCGLWTENPNDAGMQTVRFEPLTYTIFKGKAGWWSNSFDNKKHRGATAAQLHCEKNARQRMKAIKDDLENAELQRSLKE